MKTEENKYHYGREIIFNLRSCHAITPEVYLHWLDKIDKEEAIAVAHSYQTFKHKHKMKTKELRKELIEFLEANNYFISTLKTKKNAIGIVDSYLKNYKCLNDL